MAYVLESLTLTTGIEDYCLFSELRCASCICRVCMPDIEKKAIIRKLLLEQGLIYLYQEP
jgi:hypothetical protein